MRDKEYFVSLGQYIAKLRKERSMTLSALADDCDFDVANMKRVESGRTNPTVATLRKICRALNIPMKKLFEFE